MENVIPEPQAGQKADGSGILSGIGWFLSGAVLPIGSLAYYRKATQKRVLSAVMFFFAFTLVISILSTINIGVSMFSLTGSIQQAFVAGDVPEITISHGVAQVAGPQPLILLDNTSSSGQRILVAIDTTGKMTQIDTTRYDQGFLLTRTDLQILNQQNGAQTIPLSELHAMFSRDPILINAQTMTQAWEIVSAVIVILAFIFLVLWYSVVRLMIVAMLALIIWGIVSLIRPNTGFGPIIITGLYAVVPAVYLSHLFSRSDLGLPGIQTFLLLVFWVVGLLASLMETKFFSADRPLRLWTAWIGVPMLILFVVDMYWKIPAPYDKITLWSVSLLSGLALIGVRLFLRFKDQKPEQLPA